MSDQPDGDPNVLEFMRNNAHMMMSAVPWANALGFEVTKVEKGRAFARVKWREDLVGDPDSGVIHGGILTSLLDNLCGVSIGTAMPRPMSTATLDLRIDYMRPAEKGRDILAEAECYHMTRNVAFTRAWAYHETRDKVIATASGAFALNDISRWASANPAIMSALEAAAKDQTT